MSSIWRDEVWLRRRTVRSLHSASARPRRAFLPGEASAAAERAVVTIEGLSPTARMSQQIFKKTDVPSAVLKAGRSVGGRADSDDTDTTNARLTRVTATLPVRTYI